MLTSGNVYCYHSSLYIKERIGYYITHFRFVLFSEMKGFSYAWIELLSVAYRTRFTDYGDLHLSGIGHLVLDTTSNVGTERFDLLIVNLIGTDNDTKFTTSLNSLGLRYALIA